MTNKDKYELPAHTPRLLALMAPEIAELVAAELQLAYTAGQLSGISIVEQQLCIAAATSALKQANRSY